MTKPTSPYQPYLSVHEEPAGPGDARPTALQIVKDCSATGSLSGKTILITGCTAGIGIETARALYTTGAKLFLTARDMSKISTVISSIVASHPEISGPAPEALELHLDSLSSVRSAAEEFTRRSNSQLSILITNAGVMAIPLSRTKDGFETQIGTNHFAHFLLFHLLKPLLLSTAEKTSSTSRWVALSSAAHRRLGIRFDDLNWSKEEEYDKWASYGQSKTANIYIAAAADRRYASKGLTCVAVHPGGIKTDLMRYLGEEELQALRLDDSARFFKDVEQGAATTVWAALTEHFEGGKGNGGRYCADCGESAPADKAVPFTPGYFPHVYDEEGEERLWGMSCEAVGLAVQD